MNPVIMSNESNQYPVYLDSGMCTDCGKCLDACPTGVFARKESSDKPTTLYASDCHVCFLCVADCPSGAISVTWDAPNPRQQSVYDVLGMDFNNMSNSYTGKKG
jgi:NAD-dependent dihydropyrimidine dehydrogenase PreA subunit